MDRVWINTGKSILLAEHQWCEWNPNVPAYVLQGLMLEAAYPELVAKFRVE